jgi:hypothetical protein
MAETGLQRMLPSETFGRAYGLALPASLGGIVAGSLIAPLLTSLLGGTGALTACGAAVAGYVLLLLAPRRPGGPTRQESGGRTAGDQLLAAADPPLLTG